MARFKIPIKSDEQLQHIFKAEDELCKAGVSFDAGSDLKDGRVVSRDWELDWSLEGAEIKGSGKNVDTFDVNVPKSKAKPGYFKPKKKRERVSKSSVSMVK